MLFCLVILTLSVAYASATSAVYGYKLGEGNKRMSFMVGVSIGRKLVGQARAKNGQFMRVK